MSKWSKIYEKQISGFSSINKFVESKISYKKKLIDIIKKYSAQNKTVLEAGCGSGITCTRLGLDGYEVVGVDSDADMIKLATTIANEQKSSAQFRIDDLRKLETIQSNFNVIFNNGVMEHFSDADIVSVVDLHLSICDYLIISIPSNYFTDEQKIFGDERFLGADKWRKIISGSKGKIIEEFNFDPESKRIEGKPQFIGFVLSSKYTRIQS